MNAGARFARKGMVDRAGEFLAILAGVSLVLTVLVIAVGVVMRFVLAMPILGSNEIVQLTAVAVVALALPHCTASNGHVRVDVLYQKFSPQTRGWINFVCSLFFLIPFALLVIWASYEFVASSFRIGETSPDPGGLPARFVLKACLPLGFCLVFLQGLSLAIHSLCAALGHRPTAERKARHG